MTALTPAKDIVPNAQRAAQSLFAPLQREFNRFFDELGDGFGSIVEPRFAPRMDVVETKSELKVSLEVPGMTRDDIKITADDDMLTVSGEKSETKDRSEGSTHVTERSFGQFSRSLYLPRGVDPAKIEASMKDGVLTLAIPKRPGAETKTIAIQSK